MKLLIRDVVMALAYCHDHGVAHRDLAEGLFVPGVVGIDGKKEGAIGDTWQPALIMS